MKRYLVLAVAFAALTLGPAHAVDPAQQRAVIAAAPLPLDNAENVTAIYSTRLLRSAYKGPALRLRRSSDNAESDFFFVGGIVDNGAIAAWLGGATGYGVTWYDQSGNGRDVSQSTAGLQPLFLPAAGLKNRPGINYPGDADYVLQSAATLNGFIDDDLGYIVAGVDIDTITTDYEDGNAYRNNTLVATDGAYISLSLQQGGFYWTYNHSGGGTYVSAASPATGPLVAEWRHQGGVLYARANRGGESSVASSDTTAAGMTRVLRIGYGANTNISRFRGTVFEVVLFAVPPPPGGRDTVAKNLMDWAGA